jgi:mono/diheme cytochrome c family protein
LFGVVVAVFVIGWAWALLSAPAAVADDQARATLHPIAPAKDAGRRLFIDHVHPALEKHCVMCHSGELKKGGLDLSTRDGLVHGGVTGPAIIAGSAKASLLYKLVAHEQEPAMPYKAEKLPEEIIARIAEWINAGAPYDQPSNGDPSNDQSAMPVNKPAGVSLGSAVNSGSRLFVEQVRPVLEMQCLICHGGTKAKRSGFDLSTREGLLRGGDNGPAVIPGNAQASLLLKRVRHELQPGMPFQGKKLSEEAIARIEEWIKAGAPYNGPLKLSAANHAASVQRHGSDHWAYQLPRRVAIPTVKNRDWVRNPIDAFIAAEHEKRGLKPLPEADKRVLLRRVYLDLIGLPPTPKEMQAFLADQSRAAYEKVVDELLASPRYGERWGRHWMDIWRYTDLYGGYLMANSQPYIWHWRDWIIESLNQDKGYDRMIIEMLAGDEIAPTDPQTLRATGYLARNWYRFNRNVWLQDTVEHTAAGFLGITLKCARCHDHKYDPIAQEEYYRFRAFFEPYDIRTDRVQGQPDLSKNGLPRAYDAEPREAIQVAPYQPAIFAQTFRFIRGDEKSPDKEHPLSPDIPEIFGSNRIKIQPVSLPLEAYYPDSRSSTHQDLIAQAKSEIEKTEAGLAKANQALAEAKQRAAVRASQDGTRTQASISAASPSQLVESSVGVSFEKEIKPIFEKNCFFCHKSGNIDKSGLVLDSPDTILLGGRLNGPAVIPRKSGESPLILYLRGEKKPRMPLGRPPLSEEQIALIGKWIDQFPEDQPERVLLKSEAAVALAEKELAAARAVLPALEARIVAEQAKYANPPDPNAEALAQAARKAERQAHLLKGEEDLLRAQQQLTEALSSTIPTDEKADQVREKKVEAARKDLEAALAALAEAKESYTPIGKLYPKSSTGRRLALANWIANKENPLTARVAVNHMWLRHFGKPLVPTVVNFGLNGKPPTHPELLDWLASEFMEKNWRMKAMHRLMVTSNTYRMQSSANDVKHPGLTMDPDNRYLWRVNPRRMEAEVVRDSVLYVAGQLDSTVGGPELEENMGQEIPRRSIYFRNTPNLQMEFLKLFDAPNPTNCYERNESIVPQQALAMANSKLSLSQARLLARRLGGSAIPEATFVADAFEAVLGRPPSSEERAESEKFLARQTKLFHDPKKLTAFRVSMSSEVSPAGDPSLRARENLVHALLNRNEFLTIR